MVLTSAKWGVHINAIYAIYRLMHISAYFHCIFFAVRLIKSIYLHILCIFFLIFGI